MSSADIGLRRKRGMPSGGTVAITLDTLLVPGYRSIYCSVSGSLHYLGLDGTEDTLPSLAGGVFHPCGITKVFSDSTATVKGVN